MVLTGLGMTRLELGNEAGALVALRESLARDPQQPQVADLVARLERRKR
jgi:Tfp pilus assembly protein PilF